MAAGVYVVKLSQPEEGRYIRSRWWFYEYSKPQRIFVQLYGKSI